MGKFASPTKDSTFKLVFGETRHKNLTIDFLNSFLGRTAGNLIANIDFMKEEQTPRQFQERKSILDIHCKDEAGHEFIIEMQSNPEVFFVDRSLYYAACLLSRQLEKNELFTDLKPVIVIGILDYSLLATPDKYISNHFVTNMQTGKQSTNLIELHFVELPKFKKTEDQLETQTDKWIYFLKNANTLSQIPQSCQNSPQIAEAFHLMERNNWDEKQTNRYESDLLNYKKKLTDDYLLIEQGKEKGLRQAIESTAIKMLKKNMKIEEIADLTELSMEEIQVLQEKIKN